MAEVVTHFYVHIYLFPFVFLSVFLFSFSYFSDFIYLILFLFCLCSCFFWNLFFCLTFRGCCCCSWVLLFILCRPIEPCDNLSFIPNEKACCIELFQVFSLCFMSLYYFSFLYFYFNNKDDYIG